MLRWTRFPEIFLASDSHYHHSWSRGKKAVQSSPATVLHRESGWTLYARMQCDSPKWRQDALSRPVFSRWRKGWDSRSRWFVEIFDDRLQKRQNQKHQDANSYAYKYSVSTSKELHSPYGKLSTRQIQRARCHARTIGPGQVPEEKIHHRVRIDMTKVDHFVEFINRPILLSRRVLRN